jgi:hypothetical protein
LLAALSRNKDFGGLRIIGGKSLRDEENSPRTLLFGDCAIKENKHLDKATRLRRCPPKFTRSLRLLVNQMESPLGRIAFYCRLAFFLVKASLGIGMLPLPRFEVYKNNPAFDKKHFRLE